MRGRIYLPIQGVLFKILRKTSLFFKRHLCDSKVNTRGVVMLKDVDYFNDNKIEYIADLDNPFEQMKTF